MEGFRATRTILSLTRSSYVVWRQVLRKESTISPQTNLIQDLSYLKQEPKLAAASEIVKRYDTFLFDVDGVLWNTDESPIPGITDSLEKLKELDKTVILVTNNSINSRKYLQKVIKRRLGYDFPKENIFTVAYTAALFVKEIANVQGTVYLMGSPGMASEMDDLEINHVGFGPDPDPPSMDPQEILQRPLHENIGAVVVGMDPYIGFNKFSKAASYLYNPNCYYVATNCFEGGLHVGQGKVMPITGTFVTALNFLSKREPVVIGKPHKYMLECIETKHFIQRGRTIMVGDNLRADIGFAKTVGIDSLLVLSGANNLQDVQENLESDCPSKKNLIPDYYAMSLADLCKSL
ncbi:glycerol-3-phosphate phosphatase [Lingula anatina]|uniref:Glycerol-3-phosphate phosphatase n=1 Tax=Lingula anatina TaxID=7574 RepID=A0A1S3KGU6_LINAN|nr:glycerol-3-phosphate phosphatase [Lingula anatina]|eukprot:XP_013421451.1 glycerol-3-phosphate phosphatase [Lingula anatina]